jgi:hypothetical protein
MVGLSSVTRERSANEEPVLNWDCNGMLHGPCDLDNQATACRKNESIWRDVIDTRPLRLRASMLLCRSQRSDLEAYDQEARNQEKRQIDSKSYMNEAFRVSKLDPQRDEDNVSFQEQIDVRELSDISIHEAKKVEDRLEGSRSSKAAEEVENEFSNFLPIFRNETQSLHKIDDTNPIMKPPNEIILQEENVVHDFYGKSLNYSAKNVNQYKNRPEVIAFESNCKELIQMANSQSTNFDNSIREARDRKLERRHQKRKKFKGIRTVAIIDIQDNDEISALTDDMYLANGMRDLSLKPAGKAYESISWQDSELIGLNACLGLSLLSTMRCPTPPPTRNNNSDLKSFRYQMASSCVDNNSPKSIADEALLGRRRDSDRNLLKKQRKLNEYQWQVKNDNLQSEATENNARQILDDLEGSLPHLRVYQEAYNSPLSHREARETYPESKHQPRRVHFADPVVTSIKLRPLTTASEKSILFFDPNELITLERDRANRIPGEKFECIAVPKGDTLQVSISVPNTTNKVSTK